MKNIEKEVLKINAIANNLDIIADTMSGDKSLAIWGLSEHLKEIAERLEDYE